MRFPFKEKWQTPIGVSPFIRIAFHNKTWLHIAGLRACGFVCGRLLEWEEGCPSQCLINTTHKFLKMLVSIGVLALSSCIPSDSLSTIQKKKKELWCTRERKAFFLGCSLTSMPMRSQSDNSAPSRAWTYFSLSLSFSFAPSMSLSL